MKDRELDLLDRLARDCGVVEGYYDVWRNLHVTGPRTKRRLLEAMGLRAATSADLEAELARRPPAGRRAAADPANPEKAYAPPALDGGGRVWGVNLPLYGVRSARNWGVGDFADLEAAAVWAAGLGADFVGLLPLHALFDELPYGVSPYYPSSRLFLNPVYVAVDRVPEAACPEVRAFLESGAARAEVERLRASALVDYPGAWALKREALRLCFAEHRRSRAAGDNPGRAAAFDAWRAAQGRALEDFATFSALREHRAALDGHATGWQAWPAELRRPDAPGVLAFRWERPDDVELHAWVQWLADGQVAAAAARGMEAGLRVGLYLDMALGGDPSGADSWIFQDLLALTVSAGCPPDPFSLLGQRWGLPPAVPERHRAAGYALLRGALGRNAAHAGALRIDHALALWRLFWIPGDLPASAGAYVRERPEELLALLRGVSVDNRCLIVGEDLGTIPEEVRQGLMASGFYSYRVAIFERDAWGRNRRPADYPRQALVSASTHDLPTLDGFWLGADLELKRALSRYPDEEAELADREGRAGDRAGLLEALAAEGLLPEGTAPSEGPAEEDLDALAAAVHGFLARSASALLLVNLDDLFGEREMQNLPGTVDEHPNWRRKCATPLEAWAGHPRAERSAEAIRAEGRGRPRPS